MACTNPMLMAVVDLKGSPRAYFKQNQVKGWKVSTETGKAYRLVSKSSRGYHLEDIPSYMNFETMEVPCGKCIQCRLDNAQDWAIRCSHEASLYKHNYFLTLTYDDEHITRGKFGNPTLVKKDFQNFMKNLRKKLKKEFSHVGCRFFGCGEYGDENLRPHLHIILFNCPLNDLTIDFPDGEGHIIHKFNKLGLPMFYSNFIASCWRDKDGNSKGFICLDDANFNTESYVSRYILKKQKGETSSIYSKVLGVEPPFVLMSNRPGIGYTFFDSKKEKYSDNPQVFIKRPTKEPLIGTIPRYYKKKLFDLDPSLREKFELNAKIKASGKRSIYFYEHTTINKQRVISEERSIKVAKIYKRDVD